MTGRWLTLNAAALRLGVSIEDVIRLGGDDGPLKVQFMHEHFSVLEESVTAYLAEHPNGPAWTPWTDPDYRREQADFDDTPTDEGDEH